MPSESYIEIHWSCGSLDEARRVCRYLVQERLVACAQIVPWIESIYLWNNQMETTQESRILLKTREALFERVRKVILDHTSYEVPEITYTCLDGGHLPYLAWIEESTPEGFSSQIVEREKPR